ncbi:MAG: hypothetical protein IIB39_03905 [Candidatus Marinimicrobia bacterium]|nr:hypothetical protein [Candidatus Neomarinimicrobiota bacterium]
MTEFLKIKLISLLRYGKGLTKGTLFMEIATTSVFALFGYGAYKGINITLAFLINEVHLPVVFLHSLLATALFALFVMTALGSSVTAFSAFFRSDEVEYLFNFPLKPENIFLYKFSENFFRSSTPMFLLGGAALIAYGTFFNLSINEYLLIIFGIALPFIFAAAAMGTILLFLVVRLSTLLPSKIVITAMLLLTLGGSGSYLQSVHPVDQVKEIIQYYPNFEEHPAIASGGFNEVAFVPSTWAARALFSIVEEDYDNALPHIGLMIFTCLSLISVLYIISGRAYYQTWLNTRGKEWFVKRSQYNRFSKAFQTLRLPLSKKTEALIKRDFLLFVREPSQWVHMIIFMVLLFIYIANISGLSLYISDPFRMTLLYIANFIFSGFFLVSLAVRFIFPLMSQEGNAFWLIRSAPLTMKYILRYKGISASLILLIIGLPLIGFTSSALNPGKSLYLMTIAFTAISSVVITVLSLSTGAWFADLRENSAIRIASSRGATVAFLITMFYLVAGSSLLSAAVLDTYNFKINNLPYDAGKGVIIMTIFFVFSLIIAVIGIYIGNKALLRENVYAK